MGTCSNNDHRLKGKADFSLGFPDKDLGQVELKFELPSQPLTLQFLVIGPKHGSPPFSALVLANLL